ncbi:MAG: hypothetical protein AAF466_14420, partial [Bacteroidota bacterium]
MKKHYLSLVVWALFVLFSSVHVFAQERIASLQEPFVVLLDPSDGSVVDPTFIDLSPLAQGTPKALVQVDDEIWISDQIEDRIDRFDLSGTYISTIGGQVSGGGLDNIKGMAVVNNTEVWVTNAGSNNDAPGDAIVRFDLDGNNLGFFATSGSDSTFDVIDVGGEVYISYISGESKIERRDYSGNVLGNIVEEGVVQFIQQLELNNTNSSVYAAVFSTLGGNPSGLYEFAVSDGAILNYWGAEGSLRGVAALEDGNILISNSGGVYILDPNTGIATTISNDSGQYFGHISLTPCTPPPPPTGDSNQTFNEGATIEDIVVTPTDVTWFATENDALNGTNPLPAGTLLVDNTTYYAVNIVDDCLSDPFAVTVTILLSVNDVSLDSLVVYPNPANDVLLLEAGVTIERMEVYNLAGQLLHQKNVIS